MNVLFCTSLLLLYSSTVSPGDVLLIFCYLLFPLVKCFYTQNRGCHLCSSSLLCCLCSFFFLECDYIMLSLEFWKKSFLSHLEIAEQHSRCMFRNTNQQTVSLRHHILRLQQTLDQHHYKLVYLRRFLSDSVYFLHHTEKHWHKFIEVVAFQKRKCCIHVISLPA